MARKLIFFRYFCAGSALLLGVTLGGGGFSAYAAKKGPTVVQAPHGISIVTVFDNYAVNPQLTTRWGFAAVVMTPSAGILFDTGSDGRTLLANMAKLNIQPADIHKIVISHVHMDHLGGLREFLKVDRNVEVYIPVSFPDSVRQLITASGAYYRGIIGPMQIDEGVFTTGEMGTSPIEQSLAVNTNEGLVVVTGCTHPGIARIVKKAKKVVPNRPIALVMGGFHLGGASDAQLRGLIQNFRQLGVRKVAPSHCSGDGARTLFEAEYKEDYLLGGVGAIFNLK